jgi:predicted secreted acid phosphatase
MDAQSQKNPPNEFLENLKKNKEMLASHIQRMKKLEGAVGLAKRNEGRIKDQAEIIERHDGLLKTVVSQSDFGIKLDSFKSEIIMLVGDRLSDFSKRFSGVLKQKVDADVFIEKINEKATKEMLSEINEQIVEFYNKMGLINQYLEQKRRDEEENRNPIQRELDRLGKCNALISSNF